MPILDLTLIGLAVTLEPVPITAFILLLIAESGTMKGLGYILGWLASLVLVIAGVLLVTGGKPPRPHTSPSTAAIAVKITLGVVLILVAVRQRQRAGRPRKPPTWMTKLDRLSVVTAFGLGIFLQPWVLVAAGAATVAQMHVDSARSFVLLFAFCILCTATLLAMELYTAFAPEAAKERLNALRTWVGTHRDQVIIVLSLVVGLWLVGDGIYLIVT